jgi:hypothetical protein
MLSKMLSPATTLAKVIGAEGLGVSMAIAKA